MGRCKNNRHILAYPPANAFKPCGPYAPQGEPISLSLDEYESIRLLDYKGLQQTEAAEAMRIGGRSPRPSSKDGPWTCPLAISISIPANNAKTIS